MTLTKQMVAVGAAGRTTKYSEHNDDFPTPPWATRALLKYVVPDIVFKGKSVLEPASGRGHLADVMKRDAGAKMLRYDLNAYDGASNKLGDYTDLKRKFPRAAFTITNPPYAQASDFVLRAIKESDEGVGMLIQTLWMKGKSRWELVMNVCPPTRVGFFTKFIPATRGRVVQSCPVFMSHSWFWWDKGRTGTQLILIPPFAQAELERPEDYT